MQHSAVTVLSPVAPKRATGSYLYSSRQQAFIISVHVMFPSRILCSPRQCYRRSEDIRSSLLLPAALDQWVAVSARGIVVEGIAKRAMRGESRSCYGGEGTTGRGQEWLNYFRDLP